MRVSLCYAFMLLTLLTACSDEAVEAPSQSPDLGPPSVPLQNLEGRVAGAFTALWGTEDEAPRWFVGGRGEPAEGFVAYRSEESISPVWVEPGAPLWWITGHRRGDEAPMLWACGGEGRLLAHAPDSPPGEWRVHPLPLSEAQQSRTTLWGAWVSPSGRLWLVGGSDRRGGPKGLLFWRDPEGELRRITDPALPIEDEADPLAGLNIYKVWGRSDEEVYLVGEGGLIIRWDGEVFEIERAAEARLLFTVAGPRSGGEVVAVGGYERAQLWSLEAQSARPVKLPEGLPALNGVSYSPEGWAAAVGQQGLVLHKGANQRWVEARVERSRALSAVTLHAAHAGATLWVVGGDLQRFSDGVIATTEETRPVLSGWSN